MAIKISLKGKSDNPSESADTVERSSVGQRSIHRSFADMTSYADRFHRIRSVFNGQTVTRHQIGLIDVSVFSEMAESCKYQLKQGHGKENCMLLADGELLNSLWLVI